MKIIKAYWKHIALIITALGLVYAFGSGVAKRDSTTKKNCDDIIELKDCDKEIAEVLGELKDLIIESRQEQKVITEMYRLLRPTLLKEAELKVKNHNDSINNVSE